MPDDLKINISLFGAKDAFEVLLGDVMRTEPFPREIQVIGYALGWRHKLEQAAQRRGLTIEVTVKEAT